MFDLVLTMAGRGQRFVDEGYSQPKAAIAARGKPLLWWSVASVRHLLDASSTLVFVVREEDDLLRLVQDTVRSFGLGEASVVPLSATTDGQATTALHGAAALPEGRPFFVYNADTHVAPGALRPPPGCDAWIPYFVAEGSSWSFVDVDGHGRVLRVAEKSRISPNATLGLYGFPSASAYSSLYDRWFAVNALVNNEKYIAPMYELAIAEGWDVRATEVAVDDVVPLGTPEELRRFEGWGGH